MLAQTYSNDFALRRLHKELLDRVQSSQTQDYTYNENSSSFISRANRCLPVLISNAWFHHSWSDWEQEHGNFS